MTIKQIKDLIEVGLRHQAMLWNLEGYHNAFKWHWDERKDDRYYGSRREPHHIVWLSIITIGSSNKILLYKQSRDTRKNCYLFMLMQMINSAVMNDVIFRMKSERKNLTGPMPKLDAERARPLGPRDYEQTLKKIKNESK